MKPKHRKSQLHGNLAKTTKKIMGAMLAVFVMNAAVFGDSLKTQIESAVQPLLDWKPKCALVIGIVANSEQEIFSYGQLSHENPQPPDGDTVFEIGSITKVFTAILLSDMTMRGEVQLNDPIHVYLPDSITMPAWNARDIVLLDLARHTSGLPRLAGNMKWGDPENPYADYTIDLLYEFLNRAEFEYEPGSVSVYSNLGFGLLGHILSRAVRSNYETLLANRICEPLGMRDTAITLNESQRSRLAQGYHPSDRAATNWDFTDAYAGAGAIRSTMNDMMKFLCANLGIVETSLTPALRFSHQVHSPENKPVEPDIRLGWHVPTIGDENIPILFHNGQTGGYHSFMGFNSDKQIGVVALLNYSIMQLDEIGFNILRILAGLEPKQIQFPTLSD